MASYILVRLAQSVPVLFLTSVAIFLFIHLIPGDPAVAVAGLNATPVQVAALRHRYRLDRPLPIQYVTWIGRIGRGDLGRAYASQQPITKLLGGRIIATTELAVAALAVMTVIGAPSGVFPAVRTHH